MNIKQWFTSSDTSDQVQTSKKVWRMKIYQRKFEFWGGKSGLGENSG